MTEQEIIAGCRQGDQEARHELYIRTSDRIYRLLLKMTRDSDAAFDLSQNAYLKAFTNIGGFNGRSTLATWLYRIAVNEALQYLRRAAPPTLGWDVESRAAPVEDPRPGTEARIDMDSALATLDPVDRTMLLLRYQEGLDYRTIAEITDCSMGTVGSRLNRARQRLREVLENVMASE